MDPRRQLGISIALLVVVIATGTIGYSLVEGWNLFDSLYMTVITLATIGYKEVHELSKAGRAFTIFLVFFGVGAMAYAVRNATKVMIEGELREVLGRRRVEKKIRDLKGHQIICGYGRMGRIVCRELFQRHVPFVVVENNPEVVAGLDKEVLIIQGDATQDNVLEEAGVKKADGLVSDCC